MVKVVCSLPILPFTLFWILSSQAFYPNMEDRSRVSSNEFCSNHWMNIARIIKWILLELSNEYCLNCLSLQKKKKRNFDRDRDFHCMQMSLVMRMRFIFGDDWNDTPRSHHVFYLQQWCNFSRIEALEFPCNYTRDEYSLRPQTYFRSSLTRVLNQFRNKRRIRCKK